jgi:hypothetical protein
MFFVEKKVKVGKKGKTLLLGDFLVTSDEIAKLTDLLCWVRFRNAFAQADQVDLLRPDRPTAAPHSTKIITSCCWPLLTAPTPSLLVSLVHPAL